MTDRFDWPAGVITAVVTPFKDDAVDLNAVAPLVDNQVAAGVRGLVVGGGTGEFGALSMRERTTLAEEVVGAAAGRICVIVQTGALATRDALHLSEHAASIGADGLLLTSPFGEAITWRERQEFFATVCRAVGLPVILYNTQSAGLFTLDQIASLATLENVSAIKDCSYDMVFLGDLIAWGAQREEFTTYVGADSITLEAIVAGASGTLTGWSNFLAPEVVALVEMASGGIHDNPPLARLWMRLRALARHMETSANYMGFVKLGCARRGIEVGRVRAPYLMPGPDEAQKFQELVSAVEAAFAELPDDAGSAAPARQAAGQLA